MLVQRRSFCRNISMPRALRSCLVVTTLIIVAAVICVAVWVVGMLTFGLPTVHESIGSPAPGLSQPQEVALSIYLMINRTRLDQPAGDPQMTWTVEVEPGASAQNVIDQLTTIGLVKDPLLFRSYIRYLGYDRGIESGMYDLQGSMSIRELASALQKAHLDSLALTIPEGWRMEQIADRIRTLGIPVDASDFIESVASIPDGLTLSFEIPPQNSLEGFLFPDTYLVETSMTAEDLVRRMLSNFEQRVDDSLRQGFSNQGLSVFEAVILASIVEREAVIPEERPRIAAVFLNRLAIGMNLDADPTVQFAVASGNQGDWWPQISLEDLRIDSPFNTYQSPGLPPGPIASPGLDSLRAIAFPLSTTEYYFRALCDGSGRHVFAETFEEHQSNSCP
ncbi:MAG: endolytic transglycosylase MltG [Anaerolineales bacterium]|nr:MAG: endolytic transglycosylase MltG [Anaerolineales bacterium]